MTPLRSSAPAASAERGPSSPSVREVLQDFCSCLPGLGFAYPTPTDPLTQIAVLRAKEGPDSPTIQRILEEHAGDAAFLARARILIGGISETDPTS